MAPLVLEHILIPHVEETIDDYEVLRVPTYLRLNIGPGHVMDQPGLACKKSYRL